MKVTVINQLGNSLHTLTLPEKTKVSPVMLAQAIDYLQNISRVAIAHTKDRGDVRGGGVKPWRQKGTGRARAGSSRSPLWRGGGITFGPRSTDTFAKRLNKKMRQQALHAFVLEKAETNKLIVIDKLALEDGKTKTAVSFLQGLKVDSPAILIALDETNDFAELAFRNLPHVRVSTATNVNILQLLQADVVIITQAALAKLIATEEEATQTKQSTTVKAKKVTA